LEGIFQEDLLVLGVVLILVIQEMWGIEEMQEIQEIQEIKGMLEMLETQEIEEMQVLEILGILVDVVILQEVMVEVVEEVVVGDHNLA
jgi:hypothetical protein